MYVVCSGCGLNSPRCSNDIRRSTRVSLGSQLVFLLRESTGIMMTKKTLMRQRQKALYVSLLGVTSEPLYSLHDSFIHETTSPSTSKCGHLNSIQLS